MVWMAENPPSRKANWGFSLFFSNHKGDKVTIRLEKRDIVFILFALFITGVVIFFPRDTTHRQEMKIDLSEPVVVTTTLP